MGYQLTSVYNISVRDTHSYFLFYADNPFRSEVTNWINSNFSAIAREIGSKAVIVAGLNKGFDVDVAQAYMKHFHIFSVNEKNLGDFYISSYECLKKVLDKDAHELLPFFFLTNQNPHTVDKKNDPILYFISLHAIESENEIRKILETIIRCIDAERFDELEKYISRSLIKERFNLIEVANESLELKPNIAGLGINLNYIIEQVMEWRKGRQS